MCILVEFYSMTLVFKISVMTITAYHDGLLRSNFVEAQMTYILFSGVPRDPYRPSVTSICTNFKSC
jgi:hypothetical protein